MNLPEMPQTNGYQTLGQLLSQGGQLANQYHDTRTAEEDRQLKLQALRQDMIEKRTAAAMAKIKTDREVKAESQKLENMNAFKEFQKGVPTGQGAPSVRPNVNPINPEVDGLALAEDQLPNQNIKATETPTSLLGDALNRMSGSGSIKPSRKELQDKALELGVYDDAGVKNYFDDTDPTKTFEAQKEILGIKAVNQTNRDKVKSEYALAQADFNQGRIDARSLRVARARVVQAEKTEDLNVRGYGGMKREGLGDVETKSIKDIRRTASLLHRIDIAADNISNLKRGPITGRATGLNPYDTDIAQLEKLVMQTVPSLARGVFGEVGVLTDMDVKRYQDMFATIKTDPKVARVLMDDIKQTISDAWYITLDTYEKSNKNILGFDPNWSFDQISKITEEKSIPQPKAVNSAVKQDFRKKYKY